MGLKKDWWKSRTLWTNVLLLAGGVALGVADHLAAGGVLTVAAVANIGLRVLTKQQLEW